MKTYSRNAGIIGMIIFSLTIWVIVPLLLQKLDSALGFPTQLSGWDTYIGIILIFIGAPVALYCVFLFVTRGQGTASPFSPPKVFVVRGPYKFVRNPMMLGGWMLLLGEAFLFHSLSLILFLFFVLMPVGILLVIFHEEQTLEGRFGEQYLAYKRTTPRWLPKL